MNGSGNRLRKIIAYPIPVLPPARQTRARISRRVAGHPADVLGRVCQGSGVNLISTFMTEFT
jgi:hypothetical protein